MELPLLDAAAAVVADPSPASPPAPPPALHPAVWRAHQLARGRTAVTPTGWPSLDDELPDGGWPHGQLSELLLPRPGLGEMRLLAPALATLAAQGRCTMLFDPPVLPSVGALAELGLAAEHWLVVQGGARRDRREQGMRAPAPRHGLVNADVLWALEQALRSGHVGAVLAWLPERPSSGLRADALRRLQLAAQAHPGPVFLFREAASRERPSAAPLRLLLGTAGLDTLSVRLLKRRGPPCAQPLLLTLPPVVPPALLPRLRERVAAPAPVAVRSALA